MIGRPICTVTAITLLSDNIYFSNLCTLAISSIKGKIPTATYICVRTFELMKVDMNMPKMYYSYVRHLVKICRYYHILHVKLLKDRVIQCYPH